MNTSIMIFPINKNSYKSFNIPVRFFKNLNIYGDKRVLTYITYNPENKEKIIKYNCVIFIEMEVTAVCNIEYKEVNDNLEKMIQIVQIINLENITDEIFKNYENNKFEFIINIE